MKICVSSTGPGLDSQVDPRFGRCAVFVVADSETLECESVANEAAGAMGGAGISAAQMVASKGAEAVITGNVGPNAFATLSAAGIKIYVGASGTIRQAIDMFKAGQLRSADQATSAAHAGMGAMFGGVGMGRGGGGGMGMGRGGGMGMGRGGGMGMGRGGGGGMGMGPPFQDLPRQPASKEEELQQLQNYMNMLRYQIEQIQQRIEQLKEE